LAWVPILRYNISYIITTRQNTSQTTIVHHLVPVELIAG
jgi:hypothetical protein